MAALELKLAESEKSIIADHLNEAISKKEPKSIIDTLKNREIKANDNKFSRIFLFQQAYIEQSKALEIAKKKEYRRQVQTEKHFFSAKRTHAPETKNIAKKCSKIDLLAIKV